MNEIETERPQGLDARPAIEGVHHVKLPLSDLATSRAWYEQLLGLEPMHEFVDGMASSVASRTSRSAAFRSRCEPTPIGPPLSLATTPSPSR